MDAQFRMNTMPRGGAPRTLEGLSDGQTGLETRITCRDEIYKLQVLEVTISLVATTSIWTAVVPTAEMNRAFSYIDLMDKQHVMSQQRHITHIDALCQLRQARLPS